MVWGWSESAGVLLDCLQVHAQGKLLHLDGPVCSDMMVVTLMVRVLVVMVVTMVVACREQGLACVQRLALNLCLGVLAVIVFLLSHT